MDQPQDTHTILWGWDSFFDELSSFVNDLNRQAGHESYCEYVLERLEVCIESVYSLRELLRTRLPSVTEEESSVAERYSSQLTDILQCFRGLSVEWQEYMDGRSTMVSSSSYNAPLIRRHGRGRPKFAISQEQIQYLRSMSFSSVQIAKLLGVPYMTIYRRRQE